MMFIAKNKREEKIFFDEEEFCNFLRGHMGEYLAILPNDYFERKAIALKKLQEQTNR